MGTSLPAFWGNCDSRDHPHAYGDKKGQPLRTLNGKGSSPRVWGQVHKVSDANLTIRIIPTRMGTSVICDILSLRRWDHPHAYGDKTKEIKENSGFAKSTA